MLCVLMPIKKEFRSDKLFFKCFVCLFFFKISGFLVLVTSWLVLPKVALDCNSTKSETSICVYTVSHPSGEWERGEGIFLFYFAVPRDSLPRINFFKATQQQRQQPEEKKNKFKRLEGFIKSEKFVCVLLVKYTLYGCIAESFKIQIKEILSRIRVPLYMCPFAFRMSTI